MENRCINPFRIVAKSIKDFFGSDDLKGSFFLITLPGSMDNVVDNFDTRGLSKFTEIEPKILDIAAKHDVEDSGHAHCLPRRLCAETTSSYAMPPSATA